MKKLLFVMSHLTGSAVLDQGPDHRPFLGLPFCQAETKIYVILEGVKKSKVRVSQADLQRCEKVIIFPLVSRRLFLPQSAITQHHSSC